MSEESRGPLISLNCRLDEWAGATFSYGAENGLGRRQTVLGRFHDYCELEYPDRFPDFLDKRVQIVISSPPNQEWLKKIKDVLGVNSACGLIEVDEGVKAENTEDSDRMVDQPPIRIRLALRLDVFESLTLSAQEARRFDCTVMATFNFFGHSWATADGCAPTFPDLCHLDLSENRFYAVDSFDFSFIPAPSKR